jgi:hypothetical protein
MYYQTKPILLIFGQRHHPSATLLLAVLKTSVVDLILPTIRVSVPYVLGLV